MIFVDKEHGVCFHSPRNPHPYRGLPIAEVIDALDIVKLSVRSEIVRYTSWPFVVALPILLISTDSVLEWFEQFCSKILTYKQPPLDHYMRLPRELHNTIPNEYNGIRLFVKMFLQYDNAYRCRFHDVIRETSKEALLDKPIKELRKILTLMHDRELDGHVVKKKIIAVRRLATLLLMWPPYRKLFRETVQKVNWQNILPDTIDVYWMNKRRDYKVNGQTYEQRQQHTMD